jgi:hypothetical protein
MIFAFVSAPVNVSSRATSHEHVSVSSTTSSQFPAESESQNTQVTSARQAHVPVPVEPRVGGLTSTNASPTILGGLNVSPDTVLPLHTRERRTAAPMSDNAERRTQTPQATNAAHVSSSDSVHSSAQTIASKRSKVQTSACVTATGSDPATEVPHTGVPMLSRACL